jgi:hypothetical protein
MLKRISLGFAAAALIVSPAFATGQVYGDYGQGQPYQGGPYQGQPNTSPSAPASA